MPTQAFEQRLLEEMNENPALETGTEDNYEADEFENENYVNITLKNEWVSGKNFK